MADAKRVLELKMPDITTYPIYANPVAIMQCHAETREWLLSNFIQLCSNQTVLNYYDFNYKYCFFLSVQKIKKIVLEKWGIDIIQFILNSISDGYYVYMLIKRKYIDAYYFQDEEGRDEDENAHDILIYGYDRTEKVFYIADNFKGGKYTFAKCSFMEMEQAIGGMRPQDENQGEFDRAIELIGYNGEKRPDLSVRRIYEALGDYYFSRPTGMWNIMEIRNFNRNRRWYFGQECYEYLAEQALALEMNDTHIQDYHLMWEHKRHLGNIFRYLLEKEYIYDNTVAEGIDEIASETLSARNMVLKYAMSGQELIKGKVAEKYKRIREKEGKVIYTVLTELEKCDMERLMWKNEE